VPRDGRKGSALIRLKVYKFENDILKLRGINDWKVDTVPVSKTSAGTPATEQPVI